MPITQSQSSSSSQLDSQSNSQQLTNAHPMLTRSKLGVFKPKFLAHTEQENLEEALTHPVWLAAMKDENNALLKNKTWKLVTLPSN